MDDPGPVILPFRALPAPADAYPVRAYAFPVPPSPLPRVLTVEVWPDGSGGVRLALPGQEAYALRVFFRPG